MQPGRRRSIRLPDYDYTQPGYYFVTIVTEQRSQHFGTIHADQMLEGPLGKMVRREWLRLPQRFPNIELDEFIIMPNHFHGIIAILEHIQRSTPPSHEAFGQPVPGSIPTIVRSFKAATTLRARRILGDPEAKLWQINYFERVIRDERGLEAARFYIQENPIRWSDDHENPSTAHP